jgi:hypothetical protein
LFPINKVDQKIAENHISLWFDEFESILSELLSKGEDFIAEYFNDEKKYYKSRYKTFPEYSNDFLYKYFVDKERILLVEFVPYWKVIKEREGFIKKPFIRYYPALFM